MNCDQIVRNQGIPCCSLRHRHHGPLMYVDLKIEVDPEMNAEKMSEVGIEEAKNRKREKNVRQLLCEDYEDIEEVLVGFQLKGTTLQLTSE